MKWRTTAGDDDDHHQAAAGGCKGRCRPPPPPLRRRQLGTTTTTTIEWRRVTAMDDDNGRRRPLPSPPLLPPPLPLSACTQTAGTSDPRRVQLARISVLVTVCCEPKAREAREPTRMPTSDQRLPCATRVVTGVPRRSVYTIGIAPPCNGRSTKVAARRRNGQSHPLAFAVRRARVEYTQPPTIDNGRGARVMDTRNDRPSTDDRRVRVG